MSIDLDRLLGTVIEADASDLILKTGSQPAMKQAGKVLFLSDDLISPEDASTILDCITSPESRARFNADLEADFAYEHPERGRFRVNAFRQCGEIAIVMRQIKSMVPSFEALCLPAEQFRKFAGLERGLILITGITGSGKSTSLASLVSAINDTKNKHVLTLEDPIEYRFADNLSVLNQREIGVDTSTWLTGLRNAMREAPDVLMIGECRDRETMEAAIAAAETGHLVLTTLHTVNAIQTVERIMTFFEPHQHDLLRLQLSMVLEGICSQRLIPAQTDHGMVPACEVLMGTPRVRELIFQGKTRDLDQALVEGAEYYGTQTFNMSLKALYDEGMISLDDAMSASDNPEDLRLAIRGITRGSDRSPFQLQ